MARQYIDPQEYLDKIAALEKERDEYKQGFEVYQKGFTDYQKNPEYQNLHSQVQVQELAIESYQKQLAELGKENSELKASVENAGHNLSELSNKIDDITRERDELAAQATVLEASNANLENEIGALKAKLENTTEGKDDKLQALADENAVKPPALQVQGVPEQNGTPAPTSE